MYMNRNIDKAWIFHKNKLILLRKFTIEIDDRKQYKNKDSFISQDTEIVWCKSC
jgi:hypothetical protein